MQRRDVLATAGLAAAGIFVVGRGRADDRVGRAADSEAVTPESLQETPTTFRPLGSIDIPDATEAVVSADGETAYVATEDGFAVVDASDLAAPALLTHRRTLLVERDGGPLRDVQEVAVDGDRLLVVGPAHERGDALQAAVLFDVSDPANPAQLGVHEATEPIHNATLVDGRAYLTGTDGFGNPLVIVDLEGDGGVVGQWSLFDHDSAWAAVDARLRPIHDVIVHRELAYCSLWDAGTWIVDVSDPGAPTAVGRAGGRPREELAQLKGDAIRRAGRERPGNHHSAAISADGTLLAVGKEAWDDPGGAVGGPAGIDLWDVSDPGNSKRLGAVAPPPTPDPTYGGTWTTAHNFTLRDGRLYSSWYQGGVRVHDVSDPSQPVELASWSDPTTTRFWTAVPGAAAIVASSMGVDDHPAGLYTFPLEVDDATASTGPSRPSGGTASGNRRGSAGSVQARTTQATGSDTRTDPDRRTQTGLRQRGRSGTGETPVQTVTTGQPGFGTGVSLAGAAMGVAAILRRWRSRCADR